MRGQLIQALLTKMEVDEDIFFLVADMGLGLVEPFQERYPSRFLNVGIAEQDLIGVAAGLSNLGFRPFVYTISNFLIHRCFEQIRNDVILHGYPVTLLGTSAGFDNAPLGPTHHIIDEWGALRSLPGIDIYSPSSMAYAEHVVDEVLSRDRPAYIRIPKGSFAEPDSAKNTVLLEGRERRILLISYGSSVQACLSVQQRDPRVSVLICNRLVPLEQELVADALSRHNLAFVVEDHFPHTGLYGMLCQLAYERRLACDLKSLAPEAAYCLEVGTSPAYYHHRYGFDVHGIEAAIELLDLATDKVPLTG